jgi:Flp pilus assembly pilin Flp
MLTRCVAKLFALEPKANAIETGIITALIAVALVVSAIAVREPLASFYTSVVDDLVVSVR